MFANERAWSRGTEADDDNNNNDDDEDDDDYDGGGDSDGYQHTTTTAALVARPVLLQLLASNSLTPCLCGARLDRPRQTAAGRPEPVNP